MSVTKVSLYICNQLIDSRHILMCYLYIYRYTITYEKTDNEITQHVIKVLYSVD
jgi:hypothetical protein